MDIKLKLVYRNIYNEKVRVLRKITVEDFETPLHTVLNNFSHTEGFKKMFDMLESIPINLDGCLYIYIDMCVGEDEDKTEYARCVPFLFNTKDFDSILFLTDFIIAHFIVMANDLKFKIIWKG